MSRARILSRPPASATFDDYEKVKSYVAPGRWFPCGSSWEENDVNSPSAESIVRQVLYGTQYFRREFGKTSAEYHNRLCISS